MSMLSLLKPAPKLTYSDISESVADVLEQGWTQGIFARDIDGRITEVSSDEAVAYCALGAIFLVTVRQSDYVDAERELDFTNVFGSYLKSSGKFRFGPISVWNDAEWQTQENVVKTFRQFSEYLRNENLDRRLRKLNWWWL